MDERMLDALGRQVLAIMEQCKGVMNTIEAMRARPSGTSQAQDPTQKIRTFGKSGGTSDRQAEQINEHDEGDSEGRRRRAVGKVIHRGQRR